MIHELGVHKFSKIEEPSQNSWQQKGVMKQVPCRGLTDTVNFCNPACGNLELEESSLKTGSFAFYQK
jgi:hypothetical protein